MPEIVCDIAIFALNPFPYRLMIYNFITEMLYIYGNSNLSIYKDVFIKNM